MSYLSRVIRRGAAAGPAAESSSAERVFDFHSHLLPGVDDGVKTIEDAVQAVAALRDLGFSGAVLTPHIYKGLYENSSQSLRERFALLQDALAPGGPAFSLHLAGEYFADEHLLDLIRADDLLCLPVAGERWVLVEFPYLQETPYAIPCLAALAARGYRPVIAHVERYRFVMNAAETWFEKFARFRAVIQGDIGSLANQHGPSVQRFARRLAGRGAVDIWGTDLHDIRQIATAIRPGLRVLRRHGAFNALLAPLSPGVAT